MLYMIEITRGDIFLSTTCSLTTYLLGMNWRHKALFLVCKQCRDYLWSPDQHMFFRIRVHTLKVKALCPRLGPGKSCRGLICHQLSCFSKVTPHPKNPRLSLPGAVIYPEAIPTLMPSSALFWAREERQSRCHALWITCVTVKIRNLRSIKDGELLTFL